MSVEFSDSLNPETVRADVARALAEDLGSGDLTAALVEASERARATVVSRQNAVLCGRPWVDEVFRQIDPDITVEWLVEEGAAISPDQLLFRLAGPARQMLTAERTALNFLQTLSATATVTRQFASRVEGSSAQITDTRKTLPGLRTAQKYAVRVGGGRNHRIGLYDGILIKENHIAAAGGIEQAIAAARALKAGVPLMTEAETLDELEKALAADVDVLLADNFDADQLRQAVALTRAHRDKGGRTELEYTGNVTLETVAKIAQSGVDRISVGALTKHVRAVDLSMRFE